MKQHSMNYSVDGVSPKPDIEDLLLVGPGHDGYAFEADVYCIGCGQDIIHNLYAAGKYDGGDSGDSNEHPQPIFFGDAYLLHNDCADCGLYLYGGFDDYD